MPNYNLTREERTVLRSLPPTLKQVVYAVFHKVQSPPPIIITSVLNALSSALQSYVMVESLHGESIPVSLYTLVIAESGERKTSTDSIVMKPLIEFENSLLRAAELQNAQDGAELIAWKARVKLAKSTLMQAIKNGDLNQENHAKAKLESLQQHKPSVSSVTRQILNDVTAAALFQSLAGDRKSVTLHSSDAGNLFSRANMDFIANANLIWDGKDVVISRVSRGELFIRSGKLTLALMLQPAVLDRISKRKDDVFRLSGYFARMLVTAPISTQGHRFGSHQSEQDKLYISEFHSRLEAILLEAKSHQSHQSTVMLRFSPEAKYYLTRLHDKVERDLRDFGRFADIRDAGSKIVNNATRIAALLHMYEHGSNSSLISADITESACDLAFNYLREFKALFGEKTVEQLGEEYGELLEKWIHKNDYRGRDLTRSHLLQYGPNALRKKEKLELAIGYLEQQGSVRYYPHANHAFIRCL